MKITNLFRRARKVLSGACLAIVTAVALPALAQTSIPVKLYPVNTNGVTLLTTLKTSTNTAVTFPIWRGRGFGFNLGVFTTNGVAPSNVVSVFQFAAITNNATVTNWQTASPLSITSPVWTNGMYWGTNIGPLTIDNVNIGRLYYISNAGTADVQINWTNSNASVFP